MRFYLASVLVAVLSLVPFAFAQITGHIETFVPVRFTWRGELYDTGWVHRGILPIAAEILLFPLAECLHYMTVAFHEPGHALAHWLFGTPALPLLDATHGGGVTYSIGRSRALVIFVYLLLAAAIGVAASKRAWKACFVLLGATALHGWLLQSGWCIPLAIFMGHGMEVITCCGCMIRAAGVYAPLSRAEQFMTTVFGLHLAGRVTLLPLALMFVHNRRLSYGR
ncbi:MAG TPA: hypothetical protein VEF76_03655, partial [Patescibacteria group bacterium]|nr:hypothetical protein [Patescibacteria group bacterium]